MAKVFFDTLTDSEKEAFIAGFKHVDVVGVDDTDTNEPWSCPWLWADAMEAHSNSPFRWGQEWFVQNFHRILARQFSKEASKRD